MPTLRDAMPDPYRRFRTLTEPERPPPRELPLPARPVAYCVKCRHPLRAAQLVENDCPSCHARQW